MVEEGGRDAALVRAADAGGRWAPGLDDRVQRPGHVDDRGRCAASDEHGGARGLDRGRHRDQQEVLAQGGAGVEQQREGEVGVELPLVHLVDDHGADAGQVGVPLEAAQQHAGGDDLDPGGGATRRSPRTE